MTKKYHQKDDAFTFNPKGLDPEIINYLEWARQNGERQIFLKRAIKFTYEYDHYTKGFLIRIIQEHFVACKHFLRQIGRAKKEDIKNETQNS